MKLILEIRKHSDDEQHLVFDKFPITIGRGFHNDVILTDPFVSPHHLRIDYDGHVPAVSDTGSDNGFTLNGHAPHSGDRHHTPLASGDVLRLGHTSIRVLTPDHPVAATARMQKKHPVFAWLSRSVNVWACFTLALAVTLTWTYLEIWSDEPGLSLAAAAAGAVIVIALWAAAWSVAGRLTRRKAHFKSHAAIMCIYMVAWTVAWYIEEYADFLTNENWFSQTLTYALSCLLLGFLLYGSLTLATLMHQKRRRVAAAFFSVGIVSGIFLFGLVSAKSFNQQPPYPATLEPFLAQLAHGNTVEKFMDGNKELFSSAEFDHPAAETKASN
jgi:pSer/pThr/pTyr-binding forkhead associated (FHA) protein